MRDAPSTSSKVNRNPRATTPLYESGSSVAGRVPLDPLHEIAFRLHLLAVFGVCSRRGLHGEWDEVHELNARRRPALRCGPETTIPRAPLREPFKVSADDECSLAVSRRRRDACSSYSVPSNAVLILLFFLLVTVGPRPNPPRPRRYHAISGNLDPLTLCIVRPCSVPYCVVGLGQLMAVVDHGQVKLSS
jgi:hypothetical protein